jgi:hypothetical protein
MELATAANIGAIVLSGFVLADVATILFLRKFVSRQGDAESAR